MVWYDQELYATRGVCTRELKNGVRVQGLEKKSELVVGSRRPSPLLSLTICNCSMVSDDDAHTYAYIRTHCAFARSSPWRVTAYSIFMSTLVTVIGYGRYLPRCVTRKPPSPGCLDRVSPKDSNGTKSPNARSRKPSLIPGWLSKRWECGFNPTLQRSSMLARVASVPLWHRGCRC